MSKVKIQGNASGTGVLTVTAPNTSTDRTITLPDESVTLGAAVGGANGVDFNDNVKARFGTGNDFAIWHDGSHTRFQNDTGNLNVRANVFNVTKSDDSENIILAEADGDVKLYRNNVIHLETLATGVRVPVGGVLFGTDTAAANTLDDYEEGTWTPTLTCTNSGSYVLQGGADLCAYTKVGRVVHIQGSISINGESSPNGNLRITLPLTAFTGTDDTDFSMGNLSIGNHGGSYPSNINAFVQSGAYFYPWGVNDNGTTFYLSDSNVDTNFQIAFNFSYITSV